MKIGEMIETTCQICQKSFMYQYIFGRTRKVCEDPKCRKTYRCLSAANRRLRIRQRAQKICMAMTYHNAALKKEDK